MASTYLIHGNAVSVAQSPGGGNASSPGDLEQVNGIPWTDVVGYRHGAGTTFRGKGDNRIIRFHVPLLTPMVVNDVPCMLERLEVLFDIEGAAWLDEVKLWGNMNNAWFSREQLRASRDVGFDFTPPGRLMGTIGVELGVTFAQTANITIRGVKIDLA